MTNELHNTKFSYQSLLKMALVAEHSLPNVRYHIERMRAYALVLANALGKSEREANLIADASMLHDIGMVSVPRSITSKASKLTNEEWEIVKQHPIIGADLLDNSDHEVFELGKTVALLHHERWDGSGYPHGLKGDAIPLIARICGLTDVFDTLTHPRAYNPTLSTDEVLLLLQESSGTFFDPELVDMFTLKYSEICHIFSTIHPPILAEEI